MITAFTFVALAGICFGLGAIGCAIADRPAWQAFAWAVHQWIERRAL